MQPTHNFVRLIHKYGAAESGGTRRLHGLELPPHLIDIQLNVIIIDIQLNVIIIREIEREGGARRLHGLELPPDVLPMHRDLVLRAAGHRCAVRILLRES